MEELMVGPYSDVMYLLQLSFRMNLVCARLGNVFGIINVHLNPNFVVAVPIEDNTELV